MENRQYLCIDLKSFYASVECIERGLDPMTTNLVVADKSRTEKTICLAVSPSLKSFGIPGRPRLFEVISRVGYVNKEREKISPSGKLQGESYDYNRLRKEPELAVSYLVAPPRMAEYMKYSTKIYSIYLKYIAPEDIHVYSIDEVFIDITSYLNTYNLTSRELAMTIIKDVLNETGITATAGIGTNMYLAKIAMDIVAKKTKADKNGVRIAELDEISYRRELWDHRPLTDFWRVGRGYSKKLEENGFYTMGDIARASLNQQLEDRLYKLFGVNAELLIDHAWGWEPCTISEVKAYEPESTSMGSGQVLHCPYEFEQAKLIVREMTELLVLDLVKKGLVTKQMVLTVGYDVENLNKKGQYKGDVSIDNYGRKIPKHAHGTANLERETSSTKLIVGAVMDLFDRIVDKNMTVRRLNVVCNNVVRADRVKKKNEYVQFDLLTDYDKVEAEEKKLEAELQRENRIQKAMIDIKNKFGKNAVYKGMNLQKGATTLERNGQIGGHKA